MVLHEEGKENMTKNKDLGGSAPAVRSEIEGFEGAAFYEVTGVDRGGRRFKIVTNSPWHCLHTNVYSGTRWAVMPNGKRRVISRVYN